MGLERKEDALFEHAFTYAPIGKALVGLDGRWRQVNRALCEFFGRSEAGLLTGTVQECAHPDDANADAADFARLLDGLIPSYRIERRFLHKSGEIVWALHCVSLVRDSQGEPLFFVAQFQDITERKALEQRLSESERLYRMLMENSADIIARHSPENICLYVSPSCRRILGYDPEELIGVSAYEFLHPEDAAALRPSPQPASTDERFLVFRARRKDGSYVWLESSTNALRDESGALKESVSVLRDITAQKRYIEENDRLRHNRDRIEEDLQRSEDNYRRLVDEFPEAVILAQGERWVYVNDAAARLLGAESKEELLQRTAYETVHPDYHDRIRMRIRDVEVGREPWGPMEEKFIRLDGQVIDVEVVCIPAVYRKSEIRCLLVRNVTEQKRTQELMLHSEKLAVAGQFAAAIAHEIRNPLTAIKGFLQLLTRDMGDKSRFFDVIFAEMNRIEMIANELLILAKPQLVKYAGKDVRFLMQQVVSFMDAQANMNNVLIQVEYPAADLVVSCDENQLKQVFINFIKNAIEAMSGGGIIKIRLGKTGDGSVSIRIIDHGVGMSDDNLAKLGEPFYSTKENGTGLGLMITKQIIQQHGGDVRFYSKLGEGTTVELTLPPV